MNIIINDDNLLISDIEEFTLKVRAILIDENNRLLIANYGNVFLFPGGKVDNGETILEAISRELSEEIGQNYSSKELELFLTLNHYQKNYPKRDGMNKNRLVQTHYFIGMHKGIIKDLQKLTEKEKKGNFNLELVNLEDLKGKLLNDKSLNPRNKYFQKELLIVLSYYKDNCIKK